MDYLNLIDLGLSFMGILFSKLNSKAPAEVTAAIQAAIDALLVHRNDVVTRGNLEAQRG